MISVLQKREKEMIFTNECGRFRVSACTNVSFVSFKNSLWLLYVDLRMKSRLSLGACGSKWYASLRPLASVQVLYSRLNGSFF